jgi:ribosomal protein S18 acetylase RimI-like enzyme
LENESTEIKLLTSDKKNEAVDILLKAFDDDPIMNTLFVEEKKKKFLMNMFNNGTNEHIDHFVNIIYDSEEPNKNSIKGVTIWNLNQSGDTMYFFNIATHVFSNFNLSEIYNLSQFIKVGEYHNKIMKKRKHFYLIFIGIDPCLKPKGYGTKLLTPILKMADEENIPIYLENSKEKNLKFYQKNGFETIDSITISNNGKSSPLFFMKREPIFESK